MASAANVKLEDLGAAVDELDQIRQVLLLLSPSIGSSLASYVTIISSPFPCSDFRRGVSPVQQDFDVNGGGVCSSGSRAHHLVEHTSSSSVPSSVMDVQSLLPQAMTMSISTPELLLPLGEGTLDDVDDLLTRELRVPFLALGAAAAPYSGNGSDGGFAREHGMDAEQVIKPPNSVQLRPFVSVLVLIFAHCPVDPNSYFLFIFRGDHLLFFNCLCLFTTRTNRLLFSLSLSFFFLREVLHVSITLSTLQVKIDIPSGAANAAADADARGGNLASAVIGIAAASFAVTMLAAGAISPPLTFGLFVLLLGGLSLAVSGDRRS